MPPGLEAAAVGIQYKIIWSKIEYLGGLSASTFFLVFALEYTQKTRWLKPVYLVLLSIVPIAGFIVTATNEWHSLIWTNFTLYPTLSNVLIYSHGIGYYFLLVYNYLIVSIGIITLLEAWFHVNQPYRRQIGILLVGSIFPFAGGIVYVLFPGFLPGLDLTPVSFMLTGLVIAFGYFKIPIIRSHSHRPRCSY